MKYFVSDGSYLSVIKATRLRKLMTIGSCFDTTLENKSLIEPVTVENKYVTEVIVYTPQSSIGQTFVLNEQTKIASADWANLFDSVFAYPMWLERNRERRAKLDKIDALIKAAIEHGKRIERHESGFVPNPGPFLKETGGIMGKARKEIFELLGL